jgi:uncharacterized membrane protein SpoIIM required for sporulation
MNWEKYIPAALAAGAAAVLFGDKLRSLVGNFWGKTATASEEKKFLSLVVASRQLIEHFEGTGDEEGAKAARTAAARLFVDDSKPEPKA